MPRRRWQIIDRPPPAPVPAPPPRPAAPFAGIDRRTAERFRGGAMPIEGRIDLHGYSFDHAHGALDRFLGRAQAAGKRCVLVITGKGGRPDPEEGFMNRHEGGLRALVPRWLATPENRARVLSITHATRRHGGDGAYYVLLRRIRDR
jgi:DNA-nicking Smr family endonuclease